MQQRFNLANIVKRALLLFGCISLGLVSYAWADSLVDIQQRVKPVGEVKVDPASQNVTPAATAAASPKRTPEEVYNAHCKLCHDSGLAGAPKFGDKAAWQPHIAHGKDTLYQHAIKGFNAMPAKGTCAECSDDEVKATVDYMVQHAS